MQEDGKSPCVWHVKVEEYGVELCVAGSQVEWHSNCYC